MKLLERIRTARYPRLALLAFIFGLLLVAEASACPTCKDGLAENDPQQRAMAAGYFYSILFMMSMPFVLLGTLGGFAFRAIRKADRQALASQADSDTD